MKKLLICLGTRPEAIKLAPLILAAESHKFVAKVVSTGQHREMLTPILDFFKIKPAMNLSVLQPNQPLSELTSVILSKTAEVMRQEKPDAIIVQGDTTTAYAAALAAFYEKIPVAHVEAGLRTFDMYSPFPEELNRAMIGRLATFHFAPTETSKENLAKEGITKNVWVTGNTGIDALRITSSLQPASTTDARKKTVLVTCHRRENHGERLIAICDAILELARRFPETKYIFPVHLNPHVQKVVVDKLSGRTQISLLAPQNYPEFSQMIRASDLIMTDSGGVQEEAPYFKKPVFVLRESTERPEGMNAGVAVLAGVDKKSIVDQVSRALTDQIYYDSFQTKTNPYGDGFASEKIYKLLSENL